MLEASVLLENVETQNARRTRSGRISLPPLASWLGERIVPTLKKGPPLYVGPSVLEKNKCVHLWTPSASERQHKVSRITGSKKIQEFPALKPVDGESTSSARKRKKLAAKIKNKIPESSPVISRAKKTVSSDSLIINKANDVAEKNIVVFHNKIPFVCLEDVGKTIFFSKRSILQEKVQVVATVADKEDEIQKCPKASETNPVTVNKNSTANTDEESVSSIEKIYFPLGKEKYDSDWEQSEKSKKKKKRGQHSINSNHSTKNNSKNISSLHDELNSPKIKRRRGRPKKTSVSTEQKQSFSPYDGTSDCSGTLMFRTSANKYGKPAKTSTKIKQTQGLFSPSYISGLSDSSCSLKLNTSKRLRSRKAMIITDSESNDELVKRDSIAGVPPTSNCSITTQRGPGRKDFRREQINISETENNGGYPSFQINQPSPGSPLKNHKKPHAQPTTGNNINEELDKSNNPSEIINFEENKSKAGHEIIIKENENNKEVMINDPDLSFNEMIPGSPEVERDKRPSFSSSVNNITQCLQNSYQSVTKTTPRNLVSDKVKATTELSSNSVSLNIAKVTKALNFEIEEGCDNDNGEANEENISRNTVELNRELNSRNDSDHNHSHSRNLDLVDLSTNIKQTAVSRDEKSREHVRLKNIPGKISQNTSAHKKHKKIVRTVNKSLQRILSFNDTESECESNSSYCYEDSSQNKKHSMINPHSSTFLSNTRTASASSNVKKVGSFLSSCPSPKEKVNLWIRNNQMNNKCNFTDSEALQMQTNKKLMSSSEDEVETTIPVQTKSKHENNAMSRCKNSSYRYTKGIAVNGKGQTKEDHPENNSHLTCVQNQFDKKYPSEELHYHNKNKKMSKTIMERNEHLKKVEGRLLDRSQEDEQSWCDNDSDISVGNEQTEKHFSDVQSTKVLEKSIHSQSNGECLNHIEMGSNSTSKKNSNSEDCNHSQSSSTKNIHHGNSTDKIKLLPEIKLANFSKHSETENNTSHCSNDTDFHDRVKEMKKRLSSMKQSYNFCEDSSEDEANRKMKSHLPRIIGNEEEASGEKANMKQSSKYTLTVQDRREVITVNRSYSVQDMTQVQEKIIVESPKYMRLRSYYKQQASNTKEDERPKDSVKDEHLRQKKTRSKVHRTKDIGSIFESKKVKVPSKGTLKRKKWISEKVKECNKGYVDDIFDTTGPSHHGQISRLKEMLFNNSKRMDLDFATPKLNPLKLDHSNQSIDTSHDICVTPRDFNCNRRAADEYLYRREKWLKEKKHGNQPKTKENISLQEYDMHQAAHNVDQMLKKMSRKETETDISSDELVDYYFSNGSEDDVSVYKNY